MAKLARVETAAKLLWQLKVTATKEVENLPLHSIDSLFDEDYYCYDDGGEEYMVMAPITTSSTTACTTGATSKTLHRSRTVSIEGYSGLGHESAEDVDGRGHHHRLLLLPIHTVTPVLSYTMPAPLCHQQQYDGHDHATATNTTKSRKMRRNRGLLDYDDDDDDDMPDNDRRHPSSFLLDGGSMTNTNQEGNGGDHSTASESSPSRSVIVSPPRPSTKTVKSIVLVDDLTRSPQTVQSSSRRRQQKQPLSLITTSSTPSFSPPSSPTGSTTNYTVDHVIKQCKRKRENFVGQSTKPGVPYRATLQKKFSWKQYPELEQYLLDNQGEYFAYSLKNYTAEQRKYNNKLTNGLLDLAASLGYVFEDFTFPMIRDRLRCYYKSRKIVK